MRKSSAFALAAILCLGTTGCVETAVVGGAAAAGSAAFDARPVGQHLDDVNIAGKIRGRLLIEEDLPGRWVSVEVVDQNVVLTGFLPRQDQIDRAVQICRDFKEVKSVRSEIKLGEPKISDLMSDSWITTQVKTRLFQDPVTSGFSIHVETVDGIVYLQGIVKGLEERYRAKHVALSVNGVARVVDLMTVGQ